MKLNRRNFLKAAAGATGLALVKPTAIVSADSSANEDGLAMLIDVSKCVSCWWCYAACKDYNRLPETLLPDAEDPPQLDFDVWTSLVPVKHGERWRSRKTACNHCTEAACVEVCPTGALSYDALGFVSYDQEKCSGCGYCAEFCPFGVPRIEADRLSGFAVMHKCTFCQDRVRNGEPTACSAACPTGAITFGNREALLQEGKDRVATLQRSVPAATLYGEEEVGGLHVMYVLDDTPQVYELPEKPVVPASASIRNIFGWFSIGATIAALAGFGLNYLIARMRISKEEKE